LNTALLRNLVEYLAVSQFRPMSVVLVLLTLPPWGYVQEKRERDLGALAGQRRWLRWGSKVKDQPRCTALTSALRQGLPGSLAGRASSLLWLLKHLFHRKDWFYLIISMLEILWPPV